MRRGLPGRASYALARTPVLALFAASLGAGPEAIGFCVAISTITGIFFKMPAGVVADVLGKTRTLFVGFACFAFIPFAYLLVSSYQALVVVRFFHGFATTIYGPVAMAVVVQVAGNRRGEMLSWFSSVTILGNLLGAPLGGFLLTRLSAGSAPRLSHFHIIYGVVAIFGLASFLLALWVPRRQTREPGTSQARTLAAVLTQFKTGVREILLDRRVFLTSNMEGVQNLCPGRPGGLPAHLCRTDGPPLCPAGGSASGSADGGHHRLQAHHGRFSDRYGRQPLLFWGMWVCALPFALIPWFQDFTVLLALAALFGLGEAVVTSSAAALVADYCRQDHLGSAMGTFGTIFDIGHAGPLLAGALIGLWGGLDYRAPFAIIAALLIMASLIFKCLIGGAETRGI